MSHYQQMMALRARISAAEAERDTWRSTPMQENYLEAYSRVEALSLQLSNMHETNLRALAGSAPMAISEPDMVDKQERLMASLAIRFDGRQYHYQGYHYDRLDDAVAYARLQREPGE